MLHMLIVDDEAPARDRLRRLLDSFADSGRLGPVAEARDGVEALDVLEREPVDLLFLDVRMPEMNGFDVLERLPPGNRPAVVFTTAYDEYALKAFEANAVDYLLKPIDMQRLRESVARVERQRGAEARRSREAHLAELLETLDRQALDPSVASETPPPEGYLRRLSVESRDRLLVIGVDDFIAAEVQDGITNLFVRASTADAELQRHIVPHSLDALEARLDPAQFMRVHRSALVQLSEIQEMISWFSGRYKLIMTGGHEVMASRSRSRELRDRLSL